MRKYSRDRGKVPSGTDMARRMGTAKASPRPKASRPPQTASSREAPTARLMPRRSFRPIMWAMTTVLPTEIPKKRVTTRPIRGEVPPMAAMAFRPLNWPTTAMSAALKSCWSIWVRAMGIARRSRPRPMGPLRISISFPRSFVPAMACPPFLAVILSISFYFGTMTEKSQSVPAEKAGEKSLGHGEIALLRLFPYPFNEKMPPPLDIFRVLLDSGKRILRMLPRPGLPPAGNLPPAVPPRSLTARDTTIRRWIGLCGKEEN